MRHDSFSCIIYCVVRKNIGPSKEGIEDSPCNSIVKSILRRKTKSVLYFHIYIFLISLPDHYLISELKHKNNFYRIYVTEQIGNLRTPRYVVLLNIQWKFGCLGAKRFFPYKFCSHHWLHIKILIDKWISIFLNGKMTILFFYRRNFLYATASIQLIITSCWYQNENRLDNIRPVKPR